MEYIDNCDLREWVKKSLRKALFQKAHELAVQTGCEILLRVQDIHIPESHGTQYYATHSILKTYEHNKLQKRPGEVLVSGETGLPVTRKVDRGIQFSDGTSEISVPIEDDATDVDEDLMQDPFALDSGINTDVDMQLQRNGESIDTNELGNHLSKDAGDKIDLTQDSDSDDSIVEVGEVKEEPGAHRELFKQEGGGFAPGSSSVFTHPTPYQCGVCKKAFGNVQVLENHNRLEHTTVATDGVAAMTTGSSIQQQQDAMVSFKLEPNRYKCIRCQAPFNDSTLLHNHMTQCHMSNMTATNFGSPSPQTSANSPARPMQVIPAASGSPLPQITSVTSLRLMPDGMNVSSSVPTSPMMSASSAPTSPVVSAPSVAFHSPQSTRSLPSSSPRGLPGISQDCRPSRHNIMAALLQTAGPVSTHAMLTSNWRFLNLLNAKQFQSAANDLQTMGLGLLVAVQNASARASHVFVKKPPSQVRGILQQQPQLRTDPDYYTTRYALPASKKVKLNVRAKLVSMGLLAENQLM